MFIVNGLISYLAPETNIASQVESHLFKSAVLFPEGTSVTSH